MLLMGARADGALWALADGHDAEVEIVLDGAPLRVEGVIDPSHCDGFGWLKAFWLASLARQPQICELLLSTPIDLAKPDRHTQEFELHWIEALRRRHRGQDPTGALRRALEATRPDAIELDDEWVSSIERPRIVVASHIFEGNAAAADAALRSAYEKHRTYWGSTSRIDDRKGWLSVPLAALDLIARDAGMKLGTTSDYAPEQLVSRL